MKLLLYQISDQLEEKNALTEQLKFLNKFRGVPRTNIAKLSRMNNNPSQKSTDWDMA